MSSSTSRGRYHAKQSVRSYNNLKDARREAQDYDSEATRSEISRVFRERFGGDPRVWQLDVTEALLLGLDSIVIAGTGSGKTMPFMMPLLLDEKKKILVLSPLKVLQEEQVSDIHVHFRFESSFLDKGAKI